MKHFFSRFAYCVFLILLITSCKKSDPLSNQMLDQAHEIVETHPEKALVLLESIEYPERLDIDNYVRYITTSAKAKYTSDVLVLDNQDHRIAPSYITILKNRELANQRKQLYLYIFVGTIVLLLTFISLLINYKLQQVKKRYQLLQSQNEDLEQQYNLLKQQKETFEQQGELLEQQNQLLGQQNGELEQEKKLLKQQNQTLEQLKEHMEQQEEHMKLQREPLEQEKEQLKQQIGLLEKENSLLELKASQLKFLVLIYQNIGYKWTAIEFKAKDLGDEYGDGDKPPLYEEVCNLVDEIRLVSNQYLLETVKDYLKGLSYGATILESFTDDELLMLMLQRYKYTRAATTHILGKYSMRQYACKANAHTISRLKSCGITQEQINEMMFPDNPRDETD